LRAAETITDHGVGTVTDADVDFQLGHEGESFDLSTNYCYHRYEIARDLHESIMNTQRFLDQDYPEDDEDDSSYCSDDDCSTTLDDVDNLEGGNESDYFEEMSMISSEASDADSNGGTYKLLIKSTC
jgi:hypothetical protein